MRRTPSMSPSALRSQASKRRPSPTRRPDLGWLLAKRWGGRRRDRLYETALETERHRNREKSMIKGRDSRPTPRPHRRRARATPPHFGRRGPCPRPTVATAGRTLSGDATRKVVMPNPKNDPRGFRYPQHGEFPPGVASEPPVRNRCRTDGRGERGGMTP